MLELGVFGFPRCASPGYTSDTYDQAPTPNPNWCCNVYKFMKLLEIVVMTPIMSLILSF